jgi:hypothetical protein
MLVIFANSTLNVSLSNDTQINGTPTMGTQTNGTDTNGTQTMGTQTNGTDTNGTQTMGTQTNDTDTNGTQTMGTQTNGTDTNGTQTNGTQTNGTVLSGTTLNRTTDEALSAGFLGRAMQDSGGNATSNQLMCSNGSLASSVHGSKNLTCQDFNSSSYFVGENPRTCETSADCVTVANTTTECKCGFDGHAYCTPPLNSTLFDFAKENCIANNGTINDTSIETYASLLEDFYPQFLFPSDCIKNILEVEAMLNYEATVPGADTSASTADTSAADWLSLPLVLGLLVGS